MAHIWGTMRNANYERFAVRPTPQWFKDSKLGIFVHWGPYSVPAWAETLDELHKIPEELVHKHNPYAEWYFNTIRFPGGPGEQHHKKLYGDMPYDGFLDKWEAKDFKAGEMVKLFARAGARYVVPVTKHHDGITLWDAPETDCRNTVHRGPKRDIVDEFAKACDEEELKFGVYYSTGIDWHYWPTEHPWQKDNYIRPGEDDEAYNAYAWKHCKDLIDKYKPCMLWGDIDWPKAGVAPGEYSVEALLDNLYEANPGAVINDRFGDTHWDFRTVEYGLGPKPEEGAMWQFTRGIGLSFGYNENEGDHHSLTSHDAICMLIDVSSAGGNFLLNVGPDADGNLPPVQRACLEGIADWMSVNATGIHDTEPVPANIATPLGQGAKPSNSEPWIRWNMRGNELFCFAEATGDVILPVNKNAVDLSTCQTLDGKQVEAGIDGKIHLGDTENRDTPVCYRFKIRA